VERNLNEMPRQFAHFRRHQRVRCSHAKANACSQLDWAPGARPCQGPGPWRSTPPVGHVSGSALAALCLAQSHRQAYVCLDGATELQACRSRNPGRRSTPRLPDHRRSRGLRPALLVYRGRGKAVDEAPSKVPGAEALHENPHDPGRPVRRDHARRGHNGGLPPPASQGARKDLPAVTPAHKRSRQISRGVPRPVQPPDVPR
jgi:hypothetical protein